MFIFTFKSLRVSHWVALALILGGLLGLGAAYWMTLSVAGDSGSDRHVASSDGPAQSSPNEHAGFSAYAKSTFGLGLPPNTLRLKFGLDDVQFLDRFGNEVSESEADQVVYSTPESNEPDAVIRSYVMDDSGVVEAVLYFLGRDNPALHAIKDELARLLGPPQSTDPRLQLWQFEFENHMYDLILKDASLTETYQENAWNGAELTVRRSGK